MTRIFNSVTSHAASRKKGLLIAVEYNMVEGFHKLHRAHNDAKELKNLLIEDFGYSAENIVLMIDSKSVSKGHWPTKSRVQKQIERLVRGASAGDHLFFYYSGHGRQVPCSHHTEPDGLEEAIYTCNGKVIVDNDLKEWLVKPLPHGCKLFALWDSCHSQTILDLDHYICNEPESEQHRWQPRELSRRSTLQRVLPEYLLEGAQRRAITIAHEIRGRSVTRASVPIAAVSAGNSPPVSKWVPFFAGVQRVESPLSLFKCNGKCPLPTECDTKLCAHVISLSACRDDELAFDDTCNGSFTLSFIDHLRSKPKSTLRELLLALRKRVDGITTARRAWDEKPTIIPRRSTFTNDQRIGVERIPQIIRRSTEVNVGTLEELIQFTRPSAKKKKKSKYSQKPSYSSHYRLNLNEVIDL